MTCNYKLNQSPTTLGGFSEPSYLWCSLKYPLYKGGLGDMVAQSQEAHSPGRHFQASSPVFLFFVLITTPLIFSSPSPTGQCQTQTHCILSTVPGPFHISLLLGRPHENPDPYSLCVPFPAGKTLPCWWLPRCMIKNKVSAQVCIEDLT